MGDVAEISVKNKCELLQARELSQLYKYGELSFFLKTMNLNKSGPVHMLYLEAARADVITGDATEARTSRKEGREKGGRGCSAVNALRIPGGGQRGRASLSSACEATAGEPDARL